MGGKYSSTKEIEKSKNRGQWGEKKGEKSTTCGARRAAHKNSRSTG